MARMPDGLNDLADLAGAVSRKRGPDLEKDAGSERKWLKVFETMPAQMLNAYGEAKYTRMRDEQVWEHLCKALKSGAVYMTELASDEAERRGIGLNRWLHAMVAYCEYQQQPNVRKQNEAIIQEAKCKELYLSLIHI